MVYGVTSVRSFHVYGDSFYYVKRQLFFMSAGMVLGVFVLWLDYRCLRKYARLFLILGLISLVLVLVPGIGYRAGGARRWFRLANLSFQPSEFAKLATIIYLSDFISRKGIRINLFWKGFVPAAAVVGTVVSLILLEPDLGTAFVVGAVSVILLFMGGLKLKYFFSAIGCFIPAFWLLIFLKPYRWRRIIAFFDPWSDRLGAGHQVIQSMITLGSGGLWGKGLGHSLQKLYYLPAAHTDFIFSIVAEELGLLGVFGILVLFGLFLFTGLKIVLALKDVFAQYLAAGLLSLIAIELIIHIGVTTASLPTKGLPLPFVSYGGTSLLFNIISVAILLNLSKNAA